MARDGGNSVSPGMIRRVVQGVRWAVSGQSPQAWFGPQEPMAPVAPASVAGRRFDYDFGYNLTTTPRAGTGVSFAQLRALADAYDLMRLVIETRKDQIARLQWTVRRRDGQADERTGTAAAFLSRPDREHDWAQWLRMLIEDMLVIDAACLYPRRDLAGRLYALEPVDGATIKRLIDDHGRTPAPPLPAFQQVLKGLPAVDYRSDELFYLARNLRSHRVYGFSPVEQVRMTIDIALRRQLHQLEYYTEGTVPEALIGVPEGWTPEQIADFQGYWDALLEGDTARRRHARFVPATISKSYVATKEAALKDEYDEWLARVVCFAFSISPQALIQPMNRSSAEVAGDQAEAEGLSPLKQWVKGVIDRVLAEGFGWPDLEFAWRNEPHRDPLTEARIAQIYLGAGVLTANEVREGLGLPAAPAARDAKLDPSPPAVKYNPNHDERGRFAFAPGGTGGIIGPTLPDAGTDKEPPVKPVRVAQAEPPPEETEPLRRGSGENPAEELRSELYGAYYRELARIDPHNPALSSVSSPDWVPSTDDVQALRQEIERVRALQGSLPENPDNLKNQGYVETSHPDAAAAGHRTFENPVTGDVLRYDEALPGESGFKGQGHYHRENPNQTGKHDGYLDKDGNPVAGGSNKSHLFPGD